MKGPTCMTLTMSLGILRVNDHLRRRKGYHNYWLLSLSSFLHKFLQLFPMMAFGNNLERNILLGPPPVELPQRPCRAIDDRC